MMNQSTTNTPTPRWQQVVEAVDRKVGPALEAAARHEAFVIGFALVHRGRRGLGSHAERFSRRLLHGLNLPAASDVNRLLTQIGAVQKEVRVLSGKVDDRLPTAKGDLRAVDPAP